MSSTSYFTGAPLCPGCNQETSDEITQTTTPDRDIGNFGRPYYTCKTPNCTDRYFCFDDYRGITDDNPPCHCGRPSRRTIAGKAPYDSSYLRLRCSRGICGYEIWELAQNGQPKTVARADIQEWVGLGKLWAFVSGFVGHHIFPLLFIDIAKC